MEAVEKTTEAITEAMPEVISSPMTAEEVSATELVVSEIREATMTVHKGQIEASALANELVGKKKQAQLIETVSRLSVLYDLQRIKTSKGYKGAYMIHRQKNAMVIVSTWAEYCEAMGESSKTIDEDLRNLEVFGDNLLRLQDELGIGYRGLRAMRAGLLDLDHDQRQKALEAIHSADDKEELLAELGELQVIKSRLEKANKDLRSSITAKDAVIAKRAKALADAEAKYEEIAKLKESPEEADRIAFERTMREQINTEMLNANTALARVVAMGRNVLRSETFSNDMKEYTQAQLSGVCAAFSRDLRESGFDIDFEAEFSVIDVTAATEAETPTEAAED